MKSPCDFYDSTIYRNCPGTAATQNLGTLVPERSCVIKIEGDKYVEILLLDRQEFKKKTFKGNKSDNRGIHTLNRTRENP